MQCVAINSVTNIKKSSTADDQPFLLPARQVKQLLGSLQDALEDVGVTVAFEEGQRKRRRIDRTQARLFLAPFRPLPLLAITAASQPWALCSVSLASASVVS